MWQAYNPNPLKRSVGDCSVRAISAALGVSWGQAYALIAAKGFALGDVISSNAVWGAVLRDHGFTRYTIPNTCPDCYTFEDFARDHPKGIFVLGTGTHVATVIDGVIYDAWQSSKEVPQYYWHKEI